MERDEDRRASNPSRPLAGMRAWILTDGRAGHVMQAQGVAEALGLDFELRQVAPRRLWRAVAPWGRPDPRDRAGVLAPPWPAIAIAAGRLSIPYVRALRRAAGPATFTVVLMDARAGANVADFLWVPEHDRLRGANVLTTLTPPHRLSAQTLAALRAAPPAELARLPAPRVGVVLGGRSAVYRFTGQDLAHLAGALGSLGRLGASFLVTPSWRTEPQLLAAVEEATRPFARFIWDGRGENPYLALLAASDALIVTADSVNMTGEACATGRPVYVLTPTGGSAKFRQFHKALRERGLTRELPASFERWESWATCPLDATPAIAREIEQRVMRRRQMLAGLMSQGR